MISMEAPRKFLLAFATNAGFAPMRKESRTQHLEGLCDGTVRGVRHGPPIPECTGEKLFPEILIEYVDYSVQRDIL